MVLRFFLFAVLFFFAACTQVERDNPYDPDGVNYMGNQVPGSSAVVYGESVNYEGETYKTVVIGNQTWFQRNLNYEVEGSRCYEDRDDYCQKYGRLYDWATAMGLDTSCNSYSCSSQIKTKHKGICPTGWHIPNNNEWTTLIKAAADSSTAGRYLKATSGWNNNGNGQDTYGFAALPGGEGGDFSSQSSHFADVGECGVWWSASENDYSVFSIDISAKGKSICGDAAYSSSSLKSHLQSVRCVMD